MLSSRNYLKRWYLISYVFLPLQLKRYAESHLRDKMRSSKQVQVQYCASLRLGWSIKHNKFRNRSIIIYLNPPILPHSIKYSRRCIHQLLQLIPWYVPHSFNQFNYLYSSYVSRVFRIGASKDAESIPEHERNRHKVDANGEVECIGNIGRLTLWRDN